LQTIDDADDLHDLQTASPTGTLDRC
jgi:hypothetical protein